TGPVPHDSLSLFDCGLSHDLDEGWASVSNHEPLGDVEAILHLAQSGVLSRRDVIRRSLALAAGGAMLGSLLAACGGGGNAATSTTGATGTASTPTGGTTGSASATTGNGATTV